MQVKLRFFETLNFLFPRYLFIYLFIHYLFILFYLSIYLFIEGGVEMKLVFFVHI